MRPLKSLLIAAALVACAGTASAQFSSENPGGGGGRNRRLQPPPTPDTMSSARGATAANVQGDLLPDGKLQVMAVAGDGVTFLVLNRVAKADDAADVWLFNVFDPAVAAPKSKKATMGTVHEKLDCAKRTHAEIAAAGYDADGLRVVDWSPKKSELIAPRTADSVAIQIVCDGGQLRPDTIYDGRVAAIAFAHQAAAKARGR